MTTLHHFAMQYHTRLGAFAALQGAVHRSLAHNRFQHLQQPVGRSSRLCLQVQDLRLHALLWSPIPSTCCLQTSARCTLPGCAGTADGTVQPHATVCRNPDLNRKTYEEVTSILKSIHSLHLLRVDINPDFGLAELTAEVGAAPIPALLLVRLPVCGDNDHQNNRRCKVYKHDIRDDIRRMYECNKCMCRRGGFCAQHYPTLQTSGLARLG